MTPLAWKILKDLYDPDINLPSRMLTDTPFEENDQKAGEKTGALLYKFLSEAKFFEMTSVWPIVADLNHKMYEAYRDIDRVDQRRAYLPAPITWIEIEGPRLTKISLDKNSKDDAIWLSDKELESAERFRAAHVFVGQNNLSTEMAERYMIHYNYTGNEISSLNVTALSPLPLVGSGEKPKRYYDRNYDDQEIYHHFENPLPSLIDFEHYAMLAIINTPNIIGQRNQFPHGRAEREALKKIKLVGKFPLRAWTEVLLLVTTNPEDRSQSAPKERHLTGDRCRHYCRTYLRVRNGLLEYVEGHWRGNIALGLKRSRYRVEPKEEKHD
jgi:hypothetical protein